MDNEILKEIDYKNKPIAIFGAGIMARAMLIALKALPEYNQLNIIGCVVTSTSNNVKQVENYNVYSIDYMVEYWPDTEVILAVRDRFLSDVKAELEKRSVSSYYYIPFEKVIQSLDISWKNVAGNLYELFSQSLKNENLTTEDLVMFYSKQLKMDQINFEVNLANHCNLNCQCCNHFSPLAPEGFLDIAGYEKDLQRLNELYGDSIGRVMLLGGEPLLNKDIIEIMKISRKCLSNTSFYIFTNGILLSKMSEEFWEACREYQIAIKVTTYPINVDYEYWRQYAREHGVDLSDENPEPIKTTYRLPLIEEGRLNPYNNYVKCYHANQCVVLRDGRLYTCPIAAWVDNLNQHFDTHFPQLEQVSIDIYDVDDREEIDGFLKSPNAMCQYCDIYNYEYNIPWARSKCDKREWVEE